MPKQAQKESSNSPDSLRPERRLNTMSPSRQPQERSAKRTRIDPAQLPLVPNVAPRKETRPAAIEPAQDYPCLMPAEQETQEPIFSTYPVEREPPVISSQPADLDREGKRQRSNTDYQQLPVTQHEIIEEAKTLWLLTHPNEPTPSFAIGYRTPIDRSGQTTISANVLYFSDEPPREGILVVGLLRSTIAEALRVLKVCVCSRRRIAEDEERVREEGKGKGKQREGRSESTLR
ncbi:hypothetical protein BDY17DRAFT_349625 [Neohortaea acidophila]|uniref:Uncharacterized protein n=1 Tax=Neohortaea acidophila TaxID=245834 RepID=A0A6A6PFN2_9PEZI|nr:uncharacterized protein BDY17DRAFT_349625 [Neohortaea acidophila]KAF2478566.1 hypothetical protein BDY17DRAFT_349625 [Neohortaea acidophila]